MTSFSHHIVSNEGNLKCFMKLLNLNELNIYHDKTKKYF